jgi:AMMECR1 domain-containing protein
LAILIPALARRGDAGPGPAARAEAEELAALDLGRLVSVAREAVERAWSEGRPAAWADYPYARVERGIAVRFASGRTERGCLAFYRGVDDLPRAASTAALAAAFFDPRYEPLDETEAPALEIEVSVFGAFKPMRGPLDFVAGEDAVLMRHPEGQALMQPSLARDRGWDERGFLEALCRKEGLPTGAWRDAGVSFLKAGAVSLRLPFRGAGPAAKDAGPAAKDDQK